MKPVRELQDCDDLFERHLVQAIGQKGFSVVHQPGYCYTVGLHHSWKHPELIVFGLPAQRGQALLEHAAAEVQQGQALQPDSLAEEYALRFLPVKLEHHREYLQYNRWFYRGDSFQAWQLVWPDADHHFPEDPRHLEHLRELQPSLQ